MEKLTCIWAAGCENEIRPGELFCKPHIQEIGEACKAPYVWIAAATDRELFDALRANSMKAMTARELLEQAEQEHERIWQEMVRRQVPVAPAGFDKEGKAIPYGT